MESPDLWLLKDVRWQFFGTLTRRGERWPVSLIHRKQRAFFYKISDRFGLHPHRLPWCLRQERGERTGRPHAHFLLAGLSPNQVHATTCFFLMHTWEHVIRGGHARVRVFDPELNGLDYLLKGLSAADAYESARFGDRSASLTLSEGLQRLVRALSRVRDRRLAQHKKRLQAASGLPLGTFPAVKA